MFLIVSQSKWHSENRIAKFLSPGGIEEASTNISSKSPAFKYQLFSNTCKTWLFRRISTKYNTDLDVATLCCYEANTAIGRDMRMSAAGKQLYGRYVFVGW